jgi:serine/threonine kinase PknH
MNAFLTARLAGSTVAITVVLAGCSVAVAGKPTPRVAPVGGPQLTSAALMPLLLSDEQMSHVMGGDGLKTYDTYTTMPDGRGATYTGDPACQAALWNTIGPAYQGSGFTGVVGRKVSEPGDDPPHDTDQGVVLFKTADAAQRHVDQAMVIWQRCAGRRIGFHLEGHKPNTWTVGIPAEVGANIVVRNSEEAGDGYVCQHAMQAKGDVVIDAFGCGREITDQGSIIVTDIAGRVH